MIVQLAVVSLIPPEMLEMQPTVLASCNRQVTLAVAIQALVTALAWLPNSAIRIDKLACCHVPGQVNEGAGATHADPLSP